MLAVPVVVSPEAEAAYGAALLAQRSHNSASGSTLFK